LRTGVDCANVRERGGAIKSSIENPNLIDEEKRKRYEEKTLGVQCPWKRNSNKAKWGYRTQRLEEGMRNDNIETQTIEGMQKGVVGSRYGNHRRDTCDWTEFEILNLSLGTQEKD